MEGWKDGRKEGWMDGWMMDRTYLEIERSSDER
jgi:hypothetical protein